MKMTDIALREDIERYFKEDRYSCCLCFYRYHNSIMWSKTSQCSRISTIRLDWKYDILLSFLTNPQYFIFSDIRFFFLLADLNYPLTNVMCLKVHYKQNCEQRQ